MKIPPLSIRILTHLEKSKFELNLFDDAPSLDVVPWKLSAPAIHLDLAKLKKDATNSETYKQFYLELISEYPSSEFFCTDGSETEAGVAVAAVSTKCSWKPLTSCLPDDCRIMSYSFGFKIYLLF